MLGIRVDAVDYEAAEEVDHPRRARGDNLSRRRRWRFHGIMTGVLDPEHKYRLNRFDLITPDGQPVRWAMALTGQAKLPDRVYGPFLTLRVCARAERRGAERVPVRRDGGDAGEIGGGVAGALSGVTRGGGRGRRGFARRRLKERASDVEAIRASGAQLVLVGLGCPRQEVWAYEMREDVGRPLTRGGRGVRLSWRAACRWRRRGCRRGAWNGSIG